MIRVVGLGAGGHAKVVIEILRTDGCYELIGLLDSDPNLRDKTVMGVPVLGDDSLLPKLVDNGARYFFVGVGSVENVSPRRRLYQWALSLGMQPVSAIHPHSIVSPSAMLGIGVTIMAGAVINTCSVVGANVIINTGAIIEHDCILSDHVHVATGARLAGAVCVREGAHIGAGATVRQRITIGKGAVVGAGAVVVKDVAPYTVVVGAPARVLRKQKLDLSL